MNNTIYLDTVNIDSKLSEDVFVDINGKVVVVGVYSENRTSSIFGIYS